mmetsp:Transcript_3855/g.7332  ORF Transcript_3855/g.7332 Transcript_3855/m.7332 type:complete len:211 (+) Transcript_3855:2463-3095(+)
MLIVTNLILRRWIIRRKCLIQRRPCLCLFLNHLQLFPSQSTILTIPVTHVLLSRLHNILQLPLPLQQILLHPPPIPLIQHIHHQTKQYAHNHRSAKVIRSLHPRNTQLRIPTTLQIHPFHNTLPLSHRPLRMMECILNQSLTRKARGIMYHERSVPAFVSHQLRAVIDVVGILPLDVIEYGGQFVLDSRANFVGIDLPIQVQYGDEDAYH